MEFDFILHDLTIKWSTAPKIGKHNLRDLLNPTESKEGCKYTRWCCCCDFCGPCLMSNMNCLSGLTGGGGGGRSNLCEENKQFQAEFEHSLPILQSIKDEYWNKKQKKTKQGFVFELIQVMPYFNYKVL